MDKKRIPYRLLCAELTDGKRPLGRPIQTWRQCLKDDLVNFGIDSGKSFDKWRSMAQDEEQWKKLVEDGNTHFMKCWFAEKDRRRQRKYDLNPKLKAKTNAKRRNARRSKAPTEPTNTLDIRYTKGKVVL
jgi:hypothetical protein